MLPTFICKNNGPYSQRCKFRINLKATGVNFEVSGGVNESTIWQSLWMCGLILTIFELSLQPCRAMLFNCSLCTLSSSKFYLSQSCNYHVIFIALGFGKMCSLTTAVPCMYFINRRSIHPITGQSWHLWNKTSLTISVRSNDMQNTVFC